MENSREDGIFQAVSKATKLWLVFTILSFFLSQPLKLIFVNQDNIKFLAVQDEISWLMKN